MLMEIETFHENVIICDTHGCLYPVTANMAVWISFCNTTNVYGSFLQTFRSKFSQWS